jgi:hypothetical protein
LFVEEYTGIHSWVEDLTRYTVIHSRDVGVLFVDTRPVDAIALAPCPYWCRRSELVQTIRKAFSAFRLELRPPKIGAMFVGIQQTSSDEPVVERPTLS